MYRPSFRITPRLLNLITRATELNVWISQSVVDVAWLSSLQRETMARLAHFSTAIEGNPLTLPEVEALSRGETIAAASSAQKEVKNYLAVIRWVWQKKTTRSISENEILQLHKLLTVGLLSKDDSGGYKIHTNRVVDGKGFTVYTPPGPDKVKALVLELLNWLNSDVSLELSPLISSAIAHHRLVSIHPFLDGNGRASRALAIWILYSRGFDTHHLFALDEFYEVDRQKYYDKIQQARDLDDDLTDWIEYTTEGIVKTLERTKERIASLKIKKKSPRMILTKRQEDLLRFLRDKGRVKSTDIEMAFKISRARIAVIIKPLVVAGLIKKEGQTRSTHYRLAQ